MAKEKAVKAPEPRDIFRAELAQMIMGEREMGSIKRTKEGLVVSTPEADLVIRVVQKKERVVDGDVVETIEREYCDEVEETYDPLTESNLVTESTCVSELEDVR